MDDQLIMELFWERSENALAELGHKYGKLCKSISYHILKNAEDAEECVNDAFLALWNRIPPERPNPLQPYLCKIVRNLSLKKYRANTARKRNQHYDAVLEELADCLESDARVEDEILAKELAGQINAFLETLKIRDRCVFVERYWYCSPISEIARKTGMSAGAVTVCLHRTREKLKLYLE